jgi:hypothetical protein
MRYEDSTPIVGNFGACVNPYRSNSMLQSEEIALKGSSYSGCFLPGFLLIHSCVTMRPVDTLLRCVCIIRKIIDDAETIVLYK